MRKIANKFLIGIVALTFISIASSIAISAIEKDQKTELYQQLELFSSSLAIIQGNYVEEMTPQDLVYGALKGMLGALDAHSQFLDPDIYNELKVETEGKFGGLGIEITIRDGVLTIITPIEDTPAWKAGIKAGDRIVKIDGESTRDITLFDAVKKLRGKPGTEVTITVLRETEKELLDFKIVRGVIKIKDVKEVEILEDGVAYIRITEFREGTLRQFRKALKRLDKQDMRGLILDLRNNPGGLLDVAADVAGEFIEKGKLVVSTKGRIDDQDLEINARSSKPRIDLPLVVLVNEGSASGSEIVAGALQDYRRAIIMGVKTFGKGSVQTIIPLSDGSALRLTTSKYSTPSGRFINDQGIIPDILVEQLEVNVKEESEKDSQAIFEQIDQQESEEDIEFDYRQDYQLTRAVDLLKAIEIYETIPNQ